MPSASTELVRYGSTPVLTRTGAAESSDIANPDVTWDAAQNRWMMNYSAYNGAQWALCLAYSSDLLTWTRDPANPVATPQSTPLDEGYICCNGSIVRLGATYYHFYQVQVASGMYLMTSPDLHTWTRHGATPVLGPGAVGTYDAANLFDFCVRVVPGTSTLEAWYGAADGNGTRTLARATSPDGLTWTRDGVYLGASAWAPQNLGEPSVLRSGGGIHLFHDQAVTDGVRVIGHAYTSDYTPAAGGTLSLRTVGLGPAASGWDSVQVFDSCAVQSGGMLYLFYAGAAGAGAAQGMGSHIGLATAALRPGTQ